MQVERVRFSWRGLTPAVLMRVDLMRVDRDRRLRRHVYRLYTDYGIVFFMNDPDLRLVQFEIPGKGRRAGIVCGDFIADLTDGFPDIRSTYDLFFHAFQQGAKLASFLRSIDTKSLRQFAYVSWGHKPPAGIGQPESRKSTAEVRIRLLPPIDHPDPAHCLITGTGLTHLGSARQRDSMHAHAKPESLTDSQKMFEMGVKGGKPFSGRGVQPEWFYKGTGLILRGPGDLLDIPEFGEECGEEPEIAGCYIIDHDGVPHRLGFVVANEWSDHAMEKQNYLWLAPSKLRTCSIGPELVLTEQFRNLRGRARVLRKGQSIYDSGEILTGEENMSHSLANLEDHFFKYKQFCHPGDMHIHFFGTSKLSFGNCPPLDDGDIVAMQFEGMGPPLVNFVRRLAQSKEPVRVKTEI
ncbi:MAG TPA: AraD1 family protein [Acidobacteriota bacterium]|jgi:hypothetical protein